jgi:hypothetical protein
MPHTGQWLGIPNSELNTRPSRHTGQRMRMMAHNRLNILVHPSYFEVSVHRARGRC